MVQTISKSEIIAKASMGYIKDYYATGTDLTAKQLDQGAGLLRPEQSFDTILNLMDDSTFNTEINVLVDAILKEGWQITDRNDVSKRQVKREERFEKDFGANQLLRSMYLNLIPYRNIFVELEHKGTRVIDLHMLETTEMNINITPHGETLGYTQIHTSGPMTGNGFGGQKNTSEVYFTTKECAHLASNPITTNPWGRVDTFAIKKIIDAKSFLEDYMSGLYYDNRFRDLFIIKNASSTEQVKSFTESLKQGKLYRDRDIVLEGDIEQKQLRDMADIRIMLDLYEEYKGTIREFLRVPPLMVGDTGSNKSTGEFEVRYAFNNTVKSWQNLIEDFMTNTIFPLMGWKDARFRHVPLDKVNEGKFIDMAVQLKGIGYDDNTIHKFLLGKGVELPHDAKLMVQDEEGPEGDKNANDTLNQTLANKNSQSRKPRDKSVDSANSQEDKETREEQIVGKATPLNFGSYPYTLN